MLCPVASCLACHTSGWIECFEHMKERLAQHTSQGSSATVATWLRVVWSPTSVGLFLAVVIILLAWLRLTGPSWQALRMPFVLRESEGNTLAWENDILFNVLRATLQSEAAAAVESYGTNQYRALLPAYVSAIFTYWLNSSYKGFALVDLLGWWFGAWGLYCLARRLDTDHLSALIAAVLLATSPLLIAKMWNHGLNVVHHSSLVPYFLIALILFHETRIKPLYWTTLLAFVLYAASLTYHYQWIIAPCLLSLVIVDRRRWTRIISIVAALFLFFAATLLTYQVLNAVGISVQPSLNDPVAVVRWSLTHAMEGDVTILMRSFVGSVELLIQAYHPFAISLSVLGLIFASARLRILVLTGTILGLITGYLHPWPWVAMNGYPFMYISAGLALVQGPRWLADLVVWISNRMYPHSAEWVKSKSRILTGLSTGALILTAVFSTNIDLFGDYSFAQQWSGDSGW